MRMTDQKKKQYVLGVDGGGTKTQCALCDLNGEIIAMETFGPTNHEEFGEGFTDLKKELFGIFDSFIKKRGIEPDEIKASVFGMAGVDTREQKEKMESILKEYGFRKFYLCNDAFLGIMAGEGNGSGICAINGTGFCVAGMDEYGNQFQGGGLGYLTGDKGGGGYLFEKAVSSVYAQLFKNGRKTLLTEKIFKLLAMEEESQFIETIMIWRERKQSELIRKIDQLLYAAASEGDEISKKILVEVGEEYAATILGVVKQLQFSQNEKIPLILAGSQFTKGECAISIETLKEILIESSKKSESAQFEISILKKPCVEGAVLWALKML